LEPSRNRGTRGLGILVVALTPALAAIWTVPWFVTQDGSAHVYNAQILACSGDPASPFRDVYTVQWWPIPNWVGHLALAGLVALLPAWSADRIMISITLLGFAMAILWLRYRVAGPRHIPAAAVLAALLALNITWLFGFTSFLLGACVFAITLGFWWPNRDHLRLGRIAGLSALLVLGYFCHLVSLGLTVVGLVVLAVASPLPEGPKPSCWRRRFARLGPLAASFLPLIPLGWWYLRLARRAGPMNPVWENLADPLALASWKVQLAWADPLSLAAKDSLPLTERVSRVFVVFAPVAWLGAALLTWGLAAAWARLKRRTVRPSGPVGSACSSWRTAQPTADRRGWLSLAALLILGGLTGPDAMGADHGAYLPQRVVLCGLVALAAVVDVDLRRWSGRAVAAGLVWAVILQSAIVWDYALYCNRTAGQIIQARDAVGCNRRVVVLPATIRSRFRANPLLHAGNWLGVDSGNVVWNNYETRHYYFPVQFRPGLDRPHPDELERVALHDDPRQAADRRRDWEHILARHRDVIDRLVLYKTDPCLDVITERWFSLVERRGEVRVFARDPSRDAGHTPARERSDRSS